MNDNGCRKTLTCPDCSNIQYCGYPQMLSRLQDVGMMRRSKEPEAMMVVQLFESTAKRFACTACLHVGLQVGDAEDEWDDWGQARSCESCRQPIPPERLEIFPDSKLCVSCQQKDDSGASDEREFCPRCGDVMSVRLKSGTSQYVMSCASCGSR